MPFTERQLEPIVYHLSENFPPESMRAPQRLQAGGMRYLETVRSLRNDGENYQVFSVSPNTLR